MSDDETQPPAFPLDDATEDDVNTPTGGSSTDDPRNYRGVTKPGWGLNGPQPMKFNSQGSPVSKGTHAKFRNYVSGLAGNPRYLPLNIEWSAMPEQNIETVWTIISNSIAWTPQQKGLVEGSVDITNTVREKVRASLNDRWRHHKYQLKENYYLPNIGNNRRPMPCGLKTFPIDQWNDLVTLWDSDHHKAISAINKENRSHLKLYHTGGTKPFCVYREEYFDLHGVYPDSITFFEMTHKRENGEWVNDVAKDHMTNMLKYLADKPENVRDTVEVREEAFMEEFADRDAHGRAFQAGTGVKPREVRSKKYLLKARKGGSLQRAQQREAAMRAYLESELETRVTQMFSKQMAVEREKNMASQMAMMQHYRDQCGMSWLSPQSLPDSLPAGGAQFPPNLFMPTAPGVGSQFLGNPFMPTPPFLPTSSYNPYHPFMSMLAGGAVDPGIGSSYRPVMPVPNPPINEANDDTDDSTNDVNPDGLEY